MAVEVKQPIENDCQQQCQQQQHQNDSSKKPPPQKCDSYDQPPPPDGGWGWVVVFASFMIHVVTDGVVYSFGEVFKEILTLYKEGAGKTCMIPSILVGTTLCSGPIASALVNKFGCRPVTIAGSVISTICILISIRADSIETLMLTIGLGTGIGFGLIYLPAIVSVTCYFEKYRSVATGIGVCGSGFGTVLFAPLIKISLEKFGLPGTYVLIACVVLTCVFYGLLLRPLPSVETAAVAAGDVELTSPEKGTLQTNRFCSSEIVPLTTVTKCDEETATNDEQNGRTNGGRRYSIHNVSDMHVTITRDRDNRNQSGNLLQTVPTHFVSHPTLAIIDPTSKLGRSNLSLKSHQSGVMYRKDVFFTGSVKSIRDSVSKSNGYLPTLQIQTSTHHSHSSHHKTQPEKETYSNCLPCSMECRDTINEMTDFSLLKDVIFVLFVVSNFLTSLGFNLPYIFFPNLIEEKTKSNKWSSFVVAAIGAGNTAGRIILGYISDNPAVDRLFVYNTCLTICGLACIVNVLCTTFWQYIAYGVVFGFTTGAYVGLTSVITVDLLGLDKLTNAFGMLLLFQGIASFVGPPIAGYLYDFTKTYDSTFYMAGITIGLSGLMLYSMPTIRRYLKTKRNANYRVPDAK